MTATNMNVPRRPAIGVAALVAALALAGCGSDNVGESWQCPLAQGGSCTSVAAADPAVPVAGGRTMLGEPLWRPRIGTPEPSRGTVCAGGCGEGSGPFGWLGRLLGKGEDGDAAPGPEGDAWPGEEDSAPEILTSRLAEPASGTVPAGHTPEPNDSEAGGTHDDASGDDDLRTGEVVARIWIAPFVDGNGVYREAGHVRVVLEPAGWRDG